MWEAEQRGFDCVKKKLPMPEQSVLLRPREYVFSLKLVWGLRFNSSEALTVQEVL